MDVTPCKKYQINKRAYVYLWLDTGSSAGLWIYVLFFRLLCSAQLIRRDVLLEENASSAVLHSRKFFLFVEKVSRYDSVSRYTCHDDSSSREQLGGCVNR